MCPSSSRGQRLSRAQMRRVYSSLSFTCFFLSTGERTFSQILGPGQAVPLSDRCLVFISCTSGPWNPSVFLPLLCLLMSVEENLCPPLSHSIQISSKPISYWLNTAFLPDFTSVQLFSVTVFTVVGQPRRKTLRPSASVFSKLLKFLFGRAGLHTFKYAEGPYVSPGPLAP